MFTPATKKSKFPQRRGRSQGPEGPDSPSTPFAESRLSKGLGPPRPATGTPAPWGSRLSAVSRIASPTRTLKLADAADHPKPVFVAEFPQAVRDALAQQKNISEICGGIEKELSLCWIVCGNQLFVWSFLRTLNSKKCVVLDIPSLSISENEHHWLISFVGWSKGSEGAVACCQETGALIYWVNIFSESINQPMVSSSGYEGKFFNSFLACPIANDEHECIGLALSSDGELWRFCCSPTKISRERISVVSSSLRNSAVYAKSLVWRFQREIPGKAERQFFFITGHEIQCWSVLLAGSAEVTKCWSDEIFRMNQDLEEQSRTLALDMQVDSSGRIFKFLVASVFKDDKTDSLSHTQYSLLTLQYRAGYDSSSEEFGVSRERILEKKGSLQVLIPNGRVEDEEVLLFMRLRVGGNPPGSVVILSKKGTVTVANNHWMGSTQLFQFDLPWDAGKVLDAFAITSMDDFEEASWLVLTEKAGLWAIPQKAGITKEDPEGQGSKISNIMLHTAQDEEAEALLGALFQDFLATGKVEGALEKLKKSGAFDKEGAVNVFARVSQSIVDTLAKHWTTARGSDFLASAVHSSQLFDKQQKHRRFLQFLALSKCHEELSSRQRHSLQIILEHGEKLCSMIKLRELQNQMSEKRSPSSPSSLSLNESTSCLFDLIQLVGEKARQNAVFLMDRDNMEVFYSRVSSLEDLFYCLYQNLHPIINQEKSLGIQIHKTCEISTVCSDIIRSAIQHRNDHHTWYPSPEGLTHWNCGPAVRSGLWSIASLIIQLLGEPTVLNKSAKLDLSSCLEGLSDVLLDGYSSSVTVKMDAGEEYKALVEEYCRRRDHIFRTLYEQMKEFAVKKYEEVRRGKEDPDLKRAILKEASVHLLAIAKRHEGYQTLWDICFDLDNTELLRNLMRQSMGPQGGFSYFVFDQLYKQRRHSTLLRLGEEFQEELLIFLQQYKELLYLHEIFLNQLSSASEHLHALALSLHNVPSSTVEESFDHAKPRLSLSSRRRLLNLSKIAAAAGGDVHSSEKMRRLEADLHLLKLQEKITGQLQREEFNELLHPGQLIALCMEKSTPRKSQPLEAFEVFAWTSSSFRASNRSLLAECWMNAADQDDWVDIHHDMTAEGWADEMITECLKGTVLFRASRRCYGPHAEVYDGGFDDVMPLLRDDAGSSVEGILMQHRAFPDAGKLMVTALVMGRLGDDAVLDGDIMAEV